MQTQLELEVFRMSPQQQHLWLLLQESRAYSAQCVVRLDGELNRKALESALRQIVQRHEILRTTFSHVPGVSLPFQTVEDEGGCTFREVEASSSNASTVEALLAQLLEEEAVRLQVPEGKSSLRACLLEVSSRRNWLLLSLPALCADTRSLKNLFEELSQAYAVCLGGDELLNEVTQYLQFSEWQNEVLEDEDAEVGKLYWNRQDFPSARNISLPFRHQLPAAAFRPAPLGITLDAALTARLSEAAAAHQSTVSAWLLACWLAWLWRLTERPEWLSVGYIGDGRKYEELHDALGLFARAVPLTCNFSKDVTFSEILSQVQKGVIEGCDWQEYYAGGTGTDDHSAQANFAYAFEFANEALPRTSEGLTFTLERRHSYFDRYDLRLVGTEGNKGLSLHWHYDSALYDEADIDRLCEEFEKQLSSTLEWPHAPVDQLEIVGERERGQLVHEWNETTREYPRTACVHELFEAQVRRTPQAPALIWEGATLSYAELNARAERMAAGLRRLGVGPEARVGLLAERSEGLVAALLGTLKAGAAYVPLDPGYPAERLAYMMADAGISVVVAGAGLEARAQGLVAANEAVIVSIAELAAAEPAGEAAELDQAGPQNLAYVLYTSGSTGRPKGVMVEHSSLVNYLDWALEYYEVREGQGAPLHSPLSFDLTVTALFTPLLAGRPVHLLGEQPGVERLAAEMRGGRDFSLVKVTPSHLEALNQLLSGEQLAGMTRKFVIGGEALHGGLLKMWRAQAPQTSIVNEYGPTETVVGCCVYEVGSDGEERGGGAVPIGWPIGNTRLYVLDSSGRPEPVGSTGELYVGGAGVTRGYLGRPALTAERFVPDPFASEPGARLYRTGDVVRYGRGGCLEFLGRSDEQLKLRGYRIEPGEVEAGLREHEAVREVVVLRREVEGGGDYQLVAYVVGEDGASVMGSELRAHLQQQLPEYMIPASFVVLDQLPLTANGKLDRSALPALERTSTQLSTPFVPPATPIEEMLAGVWAELLGTSRVGIHDNFFALGGHSLLATQIVSRVRKFFKADIPLRLFFENPTIAGLTRQVESALRNGGPDAPPIVPRDRDVPSPLSFGQQRLWFLNQLEPQSAIYNIPIVVRLKGHLNVEALERSLREIIRRHESLRTCFIEKEGQAAQFVMEPIEALPDLPVIDLREFDNTTRETEAERLARAEAQCPFDLTHQPPLRCKVQCLGDEEHIVLFTMHHIISDGWSAGVLVREVTVLYEAFAEGRPSPLPELSIQYADYAVWQRSWLQGEALETQLSYWRAQLENLPPVLELPADRTRPAVQSYRGGRHVFTLPLELIDSLKELSRSEGVTLFMTLLAAFQTLLLRYTGREDVVVGTPIANRGRVETEGLIGFFANTLVLRTDLARDPTFRELLGRVRETALQAYTHQDLPFEMLVEELQPERDLSRHPLFEVMFSFSNAPVSTLKLSGLTLTPIAIGGDMARFDLMSYTTETPQGLHWTLEYKLDLFDEATIERMANHIRVLIEGIVIDSSQRLSQLPLLTDDEWLQLGSWNDTRMDYQRESCVHELFEAQAARTPEHIAAVFAGSTLTYAELNARANRLACRLRALGVGPGELVGIFMERSLDMLVALLGVLKAGAAYIPLDPEYPRERLSFIVTDASVRVLVTHEPVLGRVPNNFADVATVMLDDCAAPDPDAQYEFGGHHGLSDLPAYAIYTSGSTGKPKGVQVPHRAVVNFLTSMQRELKLGPADTMLAVTTFSFDIAGLEHPSPADGRSTSRCGGGR